ncbi:unnamed protein product [Gemmata massiliana]|uniref:Uncharacterized protein n=1 Tax=Gemmata massiliana TaxID=1210884 RepID=A0A6P2D5E3_9BACT|nr:hypothetical protein [Gemmata massiliana]VTR96511.1 unnamed protein product [Gemmata massiliana]
MKVFVLAVVVLFVLTAAVSAEDKKPAGPITLTLVAKTDKYKFDGGGKTADEYKKELESIAKKQADGEAVRSPKPPAVDLVLKITNTSKEEVTIYVGGDSNVFTFDLAGGPGTVAMNSGLAFTADFRLPNAVTLAAGKSHEIPVKQLSDGSRGSSRFVYWTGPGEYKLSAKYQLSDKDGGKGAELTSEPVKITVEK